MSDKIERHEEDKPEVTLAISVFLHANPMDEVELRERVRQIEHVIENALADEDNDLVSFTYPEIQVDRAYRRDGGPIVAA